LSEKLQIVGVGLATLDILIRLQEMPTWDAGGNLDAIKIDGGGPVGTGLAAAARLGARTGFIGTAGSEDLGALKINFLKREGIDVSRMVIRTGPEPDVVLVYVLTQTGERTFSFCKDRFTTELQPGELDRDYILSADYLHLDGYHRSAEIQAARWMREAGKSVLLDAARTSDDGVDADMRELVKLSTALICGTGFSHALTGLQDVYTAGRAALAMGPEIFVETRGEDGSYTVTADDQFHTPAFPVPVLDTTGAGDVFHGAYLVGLLHGWDLRKIALFSTAVAAIKCTRLGGRSGIPTFPEVVDFLAMRNIPFKE
jgi:ribokinase